MPGHKSEYHPDSSHNDANSGSPADGVSTRLLRTQQDHLPLLCAALPQQPERIEQLLTAAARLIQMPRSISGVFPIVENLRRILPQTRELVPGANAEIELVETWCSLIESIPMQHQIRTEELLSRAFRGSDGLGRNYISPPLRGLYLDAPVWCVLWFRSGTPGQECRDRAYVDLQALFLGSWLCLVRDDRRLSNPNRLVEAGRLLRNLHQPTCGGELDRLVGDTTDLYNLHDTLSQLHDEGLQGLRQGCGAFADLLNDSFRMGLESVFRKRLTTHGHSSGSRRRRVELNRLYSDHADYWRFVDLGSRVPEEDWGGVGVEEQPPAPDLAEALSEQGLAPDEFTMPELAWVELRDLVDSVQGPAGTLDLGELPPLGALFAAARARARHLIMDVQRFTTRRSRARISVVVRIMTVLDQFYAQTLEQARLPLPSSARAQVERMLETLHLLAVTLVTGTAPEHVRHLPRYTSASALPSDYRLAYAPQHRIWLRPYVPPARNILAKGYLQHSVDTWPRVALSDPWGVGAQLAEPDTGRWFERRIRTYESTFDEMIAPALEHAGVELRWRRMTAIGDLLPGWFQGMEEGDHLHPAILFGRDDHLAEVQRYYTAFDRRALDRFFTSEMYDLWNRLIDNGFKPVSDLFKRTEPAAIHESLVGDDRVPRIESVKALIDALRETLLALPAPRRRADVIQRHNAFTTYTALGLALTTGFRAVRTPIPDLTAIDQQTGFMCLQEKDRSDGAHGRIVWLPERIRTQVRDYLCHLQRLRRHLPWDWPLELCVPATKHRDRSGFGGESYSLSLADTLFFIEETDAAGCKPVELTGTTLQQHLDAVHARHWPVANAGRHLLRSYLAAAECPTTLINAHLGHWHYGEEPWGHFSTFDPLQYRRAIAPHLDRLLDVLGYEFVGGG